jgi:flavin reductase (DIM6/NTAB) family NADH-FMN oxidoreductase RutF
MTVRSLDVVQGLRLLEPSPVVLLTSMYRNHPNVMTAAWLSPLGFDPPLISIAIHPGRLTHEFVSKSEMFGVSIPTMDLIRAVHRCGLISGHNGDKFEATGLTPVDSAEIDAPKVDECVAFLECGVLQRVSLADHDLFIAQILAAAADDDLFRERWVSDQEVPLVHHVAGEHYAGMTRSYAVSEEPEEEQ